MEKNFEKQIKHSLKLKKWQRKKIINYILTGKVMIIQLILG